MLRRCYDAHIVVHSPASESEEKATAIFPCNLRERVFRAFVRGGRGVAQVPPEVPAEALEGGAPDPGRPRDRCQGSPARRELGAREGILAWSVTCSGLSNARYDSERWHLRSAALRASCGRQAEKEKVFGVKHGEGVRVDDLLRVLSPERCAELRG